MSEQARLYAKLGQGNQTAMNALVHKTHEPGLWTKNFQERSNARDRSSCKALRVLIWLQTEFCTRKGVYTNEKNEQLKLMSKDDITDAVMNTVFHGFEKPYEIPSLKPIEEVATVISVDQCDCIDAGVKLQKEGFNPVVLNMASHKRPGGGYKTGAAAQEENLFRRSNYWQILGDPFRKNPNKKWCYPLPEFCTIYSPKIHVFRENEARGYAFSDQPRIMSFIAAAAYARPRTTPGVRGVSEHRLQDKFAEKTRYKINQLLWTALEHGHDSIVLSAWGCGAFKNPPTHIAEIFKEALACPPFKNAFKRVVFAILGLGKQKHNPNGNLEPFKTVFATKSENKNVRVDTDCIRFFRWQEEPYGLFSSYSQLSVNIDGENWPTVEHYVQAQKFVGNDTLYNRLKGLAKPGSVAEDARKFKSQMRKDWDDVKDDVMEKALEAKFLQYPDALELIIDTGDKSIIFTAYNTYWGCGKDGKGENKYGKILEKLRESFSSNSEE